jgi:hypothetical protein
MAMARMLAGFSTQAYPVELQPLGACLKQTATATSNSAVAPIRRSHPRPSP